MENIQLDSITNEHIDGKWHVKDRSISKPNHDNLFNTVKFIEIGNGLYKSLNGRVNTGKLLMVREAKIIYNPQLIFYNNEDQVANAIITRLFLEDDGIKNSYMLTLYFSTGLELVLQKNI